MIGTVCVLMFVYIDTIAHNTQEHAPGLYQQIFTYSLPESSRIPAIASYATSFALSTIMGRDWLKC